jgi:serine/threonine protein kinase
MAPELFLMMPYSGNAVDLFAAGIILFIMVSGNPPFSSAERTDSYYKMICQNRNDIFWNNHLKFKNNPNFYTESFKDLINALLALNPTHRLTLAELKAHPWFQGELPNKDDFIEEFTRRKLAIRKNLEIQRQDRINERERNNNQNRGQTLQNLMTGYRKFRSIDQDSEKNKAPEENV